MSRAPPLMNIQGDESSDQTQVASQVIPQPPNSKVANHDMLQEDNQDNREAILLNVDSTVLKLENSNFSTESVQELRAPIELAMQMRRLNDTENETAAFNMGQTIGQSEHNTDYLEQANLMSHKVQEMEMN